MATIMVSRAMPKASADCAKKAVVFLAEGVWASMSQPSPGPLRRGIRTDTHLPCDTATCELVDLPSGDRRRGPTLPGPRGAAPRRPRQRGRVERLPVGQLPAAGS